MIFIHLLEDMIKTQTEGLFIQISVMHSPQEFLTTRIFWHLGMLISCIDTICQNIITFRMKPEIFS